DLIARLYLDPTRRYPGLRDRGFTRSEREPSLRIFRAHPTVDDANFGDLLRWVHEDEELRSFDAGGHLPGLNVERTVPRAEEVDDPARQVEQRAAPLPRRKNPQCGPLVEPYDLSGFFEANGCSASQTHKDGLPGTKARLGPRRHRLKRTTL